MQLSRPLRYTALALVLAVLAAGPFFKGLFMWTELLAALVVLFVAFGLWLIGRKMGELPAGMPAGAAGAALLALALLYVLQFAWAVFPRGNIDWTLRATAAWFLFVMCRAEAGPALRRALGWTLSLSAAAVGLVGFMEFTGYLLKDPELAKALSVVNLSDRMFTTLQYPNTAAAYFLAALLAAAGLALDDLKPWKLGAAGGLISLLGLSFFFTVSRGAVVVLPFGLLLFFLGLERGKRWPALLLLLAGTAPVLVALRGVGANSAIHNYISAFRWIGAATVGGVAAGVVLAFFLRLKQRLQLALVGGLLVAAVAAFAVLRPSGSLLPKQAGRLFDINFRTVNVVLRLIYDKDAARMTLDRPLGRGGWGWARSYPQYQNFDYTARETHDHFAQTAVEAGIPGLIALLAALGAALWSAWRTRQGNALGWSLAAGAALIAAHSAIDFDLSYGLIWLWLWVMLAVAADPATAPAAQRWERPAWWGGLAAATGLAALSAALFAGARYTNSAVALADGHPDQAVAAARQAVKYDRWDSQPFRIIGDIPSLERAERLDTHQAGIHFDLAVQRELNKDLPGALTEAKLALQNRPLNSVYYTKVAALAGSLMADAVHNDRRDEAKRFAGDLVQLGQDFSRRKAVADPQQNLWHVPKLTMEPEFQLRLGQALFLTGKANEAAPLLKEAGKVGLLGSEAHVWLYVIYEQRGDTKGMAELADKPWIRFRSVNPAYKVLRTWQP